MSKFKIGDVVEVTSQYGPGPVGERGTVKDIVEDSPYPVRIDLPSVADYRLFTYDELRLVLRSVHFTQEELAYICILVGATDRNDFERVANLSTASQETKTLASTVWENGGAVGLLDKLCAAFGD